MEDYSSQPPQVQPVGLVIRFVAWLFDCFLVGLALLPIVLAVTWPLESQVEAVEGIQRDLSELGLQLIGSVVGFTVQLPIYSYFYYISGQTPGKRLLGIRIVDFISLEPLTPAQAIGRYLGTILSGCCCWFGYILAAFNPDRRGLHDFIAGTRVAYSERVPWTTGEVILTVTLCLFAMVGLLLVPFISLAIFMEMLEAAENPLWYLNP